MTVEKLPVKKTPFDLAKEEVAKEKEAAAVEKLKTKLRELDRAKTIVRNIEREIDDLKHEIEQGNA